MKAKPLGAHRRTWPFDPGDAFATPKATCVGAEGVEGTEGAEGAERGWWKLKGAVVELCSEEEEPVPWSGDGCWGSSSSCHETFFVEFCVIHA